MVCASLRGVGNADVIVLSDTRQPTDHATTVLGDYCGLSNSDSKAGGLWVTEE